MKLPFVSRERFAEAQALAARLEEENRALAAQVVELRLAAATFFGPPREGVEAWQPIPGKPTIALVTAAANKAAFERSRVPGAKGIAQELEELQVRRSIGK